MCTHKASGAGAARTVSHLPSGRASMAIAPRVAVLMAAELGKDLVWQEAQVAAYAELAGGYLP